MPSETREPEFEILPPERKGEDKTLAGVLAWILDDLIRVPGTNFRIGLDPIIGLIPGVGDTSTTAVSCLLLVEAFRRRVPKVVLARMVVNILVNGLGGAVPGIGEVFSAWFKSNRMNYHLLRKHAGQGSVSTKGDWIFLIALLAVMVVALLAIAFLSAYLVYKVLALVFG